MVNQTLPIPVEDKRLLWRIAHMYEDPVAAYERLKQAYLAHNPQLRFGGGHGGISLAFVGLEDDLWAIRVAHGVRRTLGLLENALDTAPPASNRVLGRPCDYSGVEVMRYEGYIAA